jgi:hypothetical protein
MDALQSYRAKVAQVQREARAARNDPARWPFREAAAVLSRFVPATLRPFGESADREGWDDFLLDCEPAAEAGGAWWRLRDDIRRQALRRLRTRERMRAALAANPQRPDDDVQRAMTSTIEGETRPSLGEISRTALSALVTVRDWMGGILDDLPSEAELRRALVTVEMLAPMQRLAGGDRFVGRQQELASLREYVGVLGSASLGQRARRFVRETYYDLTSRPPLLITGPGGIGKSTLISRFVLDHSENFQSADALPFVYLDLDRDTLIPSQPLSLVAEAALQLSIEWPDLEKPFVKIVDQIRPLITANEPVLTVTNESVFEGTRALSARDSIMLEFGELLLHGSHERPVLFVVDTFEEAQYLGFDVVRGLGSLLTELQQAAPMLRIVLVGRADLEDQTSVLPTATLRLADLSLDESRELLRRNIRSDPPPEPALIDEVIDLVGRNPMSLKLASTVLNQSDVNDLRKLDTRNVLLLRVKAETMQARLYGRILAHVHDEDVKKLAKPGLVVRRLTEEVIREVLAEPCGIPMTDPARAHALMEELSTEVALVVPAEDGSLRHRPDVRRVMLKDLTEDVPLETIHEIHGRAIAYYAGRPAEPVFRAEEIYHRLMRGDDVPTLDGRWIAGVEPYLRTALEEVPPAERIWLSRRLGVTPDRALLALAELDDWEDVTARSAQRLISAGDARGAIEAMRGRAERSGASSLFLLESEAWRVLRNFDAARDVVARGIATSARAGVAIVQRNLLVQLALIEETAEHADAALDAISRAMKVPGDRLEVIDHLRLTITEIRLLRKHGPARDNDRRGAIDRALALLTPDLRDGLYRRPALLREVAAEIGIVDKSVLAQAIEVLGVEPTNERDADRLARALADWDDKLKVSTGVSELAQRAGIRGRQANNWRGLVSSGVGRELSTNIINWRAELSPDRDVDKALIEFYRFAVEDALNPRQQEVIAVAATSMVSSADAAYPPQLEEIEARLLEQRRAKLSQKEPAESPPGPRKLPKDAIGFGLSGGGIRSAIFSLGLLQALARARVLREIDFLSTVSGGGYIGAFLGRLFTRDWIRNPEDVERVLVSEDPAGAPPGLGARVSRWLRENGRYLAPRGSGDLLLLASIALRNWVGVQLVLVTFGLTVITLLQIARGGLDWTLAQLPMIATGVAYFLVCIMPGGNSVLWWSPWLLAAAFVLTVWVVPTGWAYFLVTRDQTGPRGLHPLWGAAIVLGASAAGVFQYFDTTGAANDRLGRLVACGMVAVLGALALGWLGVARVRARRGNEGEITAISRNVLSRWLTVGLVTTVALLAWTLLDTVAGTIYAVWAAGGSIGQWVAGVFGVLAGIGAFARQIAMLVASKRAKARPGPAFSTISWIAAAVVVSVWLTSVTVMAYAIVWRFEPLDGMPSAIGARPAPTILGATSLLVSPGQSGFVVTPATLDEAMCQSPTTSATGGTARKQPAWLYVWLAWITLVLLSLMFGWTRTFANMSSLHAFYAARLTRTFLGGSNERRHDAVKPVTETIPGDDLRADAYWQWPFTTSSSTGETPAYPWTRGGPLHLINVTVNETVDAVTGVQHADRQGTGLAIGPAGMSLGVRHHLVTSSTSTVVLPEQSKGPRDKRVHRAFSFDGGIPEPLPLGRWVSISGAAFSAAAGAKTTIPIALLAGMFNVRLGYWWDSGTIWERNSWFARLFPVQHALLSESLARTRGTADRMWNLSDGGHFENMGGYELIRRRLPIIVIVDAEADPDYVFEGLSDLVRKARVDFNAEVVFYNRLQLSGESSDSGSDSPAAPMLPEIVRPYFGDLDALRRGRWSDEPLPPVPYSASKRYNIEVNRTSVSRAHAALARVQYIDTGETSWLVYIKASLMGDEPEDVCHYHRAHPEFPQEPTTDQFFDEAQWESYRRLGQHVGHRVLRPELFEYLRARPAPATAETENRPGE